MRLITTLAFGLAMITAAHADECVDVGQAAELIKERFPLAVIAAIGREDVNGFLANFNASPPASHVEADVVLTAKEPADGRVALFFFSHGCVISKTIIPRALFERLLTGNKI